MWLHDGEAMSIFVLLLATIARLEYQGDETPFDTVVRTATGVKKS